MVKTSEVALPTLAQRILAEVGADGTLVGRAEVAAWATTAATGRATQIALALDP